MGGGGSLMRRERRRASRGGGAGDGGASCGRGRLLIVQLLQWEDESMKKEYK